MMSGRLLIVAGGTGGHLAPGIAIASRWQAAGHAAELVISRKPVDKRMMETVQELPYTIAPGAGWQGGLRGKLQSLRQGLAGFLFALRHLRRVRPTAVLGFGGFLTGLYALAARWTGTPLYLHEANRVPGRAVRWLARGAHRIYLPVGVALPSVPVTNIREVGVPLRPSMRHLLKAEARERLALPRWERVLLILGGSQGAASLTQWARDHLPEFVAQGLHVICLTGMQGGQGQTIEGVGPSGGAVQARFLPFADNMAELLSAADIVVSRAGAGSLAEIVSCLTPAILVPYPHAADDHQRANAAYLERRGGGLVVAPESLDSLWREVRELINNEDLLDRMRANLRALARHDAAGTMVADLQNLMEAAGPQTAEREAAVS